MVDRSSRLLVIGSSGFIGQALVSRMVDDGIAGTAVSRSGCRGKFGKVRCVTVPAYDDRLAMAEAAEGCEVAIMLAGRAHVLKEKDSRPSEAFLRANRDLPVAVADIFAAAGGRRFLFLSSIAVHGPGSADRPLRESDPPAPANDYGRSKLAGEEGLKEHCQKLGMELVIIRPPLVYGPNAPGNFGKLLKAARAGIPLPLASIDNRRDLIGIDNLVDFVLFAAGHPAASGRTFLISDGQEISTAELARRLYEAAGHRRRLLPGPPGLIRMAVRALGRLELADRLLDNLVIDNSQVAAMGWKAPFTIEEEIRRSVEDHRK